MDQVVKAVEQRRNRQKSVVLNYANDVGLVEDPQEFINMINL